MFNSKAQALMAENEKRAKLIMQAGVSMGNSLLASALSKGTTEQKLNQLSMLRIMAVEILASNVFNGIMQGKKADETALMDEVLGEIYDRLDGMKRDHKTGKVEFRKFKDDKKAEKPTKPANKVAKLKKVN